MILGFTLSTQCSHSVDSTERRPVAVPELCHSFSISLRHCLYVHTVLKTPSDLTPHPCTYSLFPRLPSLCQSVSAPTPTLLGRPRHIRILFLPPGALCNFSDAPWEILIIYPFSTSTRGRRRVKVVNDNSSNGELATRLHLNCDNGAVDSDPPRGVRSVLPSATPIHVEAIEETPMHGKNPQCRLSKSHELILFLSRCGEPSPFFWGIGAFLVICDQRCKAIGVSITCLHIAQSTFFWCSTTVPTRPSRARFYAQVFRVSKLAATLTTKLGIRLTALIITALPFSPRTFLLNPLTTPQLRVPVAAENSRAS